MTRTIIAELVTCYVCDKLLGYTNPDIKLKMKKVYCSPKHYKQDGGKNG